MTGAHVSVQHGELIAMCHQYPDRPPILTVLAGGVNLSVTVDRDAQDSPVEGLVRAVEQYAAALAQWRQHRAECSCGLRAVTP